MSHVVRFDCFEVDLTLGQLRKRNVRLHVREQSFQVLAMLLERPGEMVSRNALRRRLWGDAVFVDFESILNTAVARLREALGDSARRPRFIETVPRRGYRFNADVLVQPADDSKASRTRLLVLPFANLTGSAGQEYFSDAMTDELITALACLAPERLAVIARTTAMHYKNSRKDVPRIRREVGVDYVVEGSVRQTGPQVVVNVQLIETGNQTHLFAKRYQTQPGDIFHLQERIAIDIGAHIVPAASGAVREEESRRKPTENLAAYHEYIQARYEMWKWTPEGVANARRQFEAALAIDPRFALACDGLANLYGYLGLWGFLPPDQAEPLRWFYGSRAAELDPLLAEPRTHVAYHPQKTRYEDAYTYNWTEAEKGMAAARDASPHSPLIRVRHSTVLLVLGRLEEAMAELQCALEFDPLSPEIGFWLTWVLFLARDYQQALGRARAALALEPAQPFAHMMLGVVYLGMRCFEQSVAAFREAATLSNDFPLVLGWLGFALGLGGWADEARTVLERLRMIAKERFVLPTSFAWVHLGLGEIDEALRWMEEAVNHNDEWIHPIKTYPFLDGVRDDARFKSLLRKLSV